VPQGSNRGSNGASTGNGGLQGHDALAVWLAEDGPSLAGYLRLVENTYGFDDFAEVIGKACGFTPLLDTMAGDTMALHAFVNAEYHEVKAMSDAIAERREVGA
jgi:hypothetical protein